MSELVQFPLEPMLAKAVAAVPAQGAWIFEPKWDGFRCLIYRRGQEVDLISRSGKSLNRYFPEVVAFALEQLPSGCVLDGELVVARTYTSPSGAGYQRLDFEALSQRIHPAASRVELLSQSTPAEFIAFDLLCEGGVNLMHQPFSQRRAALLELVGSSALQATVTTTDPVVAQEWFGRFEGAGLDGVIAKGADDAYTPGKRTMLKIKHKRTADCVLLGYRPHTSIDGVGSLLLGLHDEQGQLCMVGGASAFTAVRRAELLKELQPLVLSPGAVAHGEQNRWTSRADSRYVPLRPERVLEVEYDQMEGSRFRHAVKFLRWREDREPASCGFDQLEIPVHYDVRDVLLGSTGAKD